MDDTTTHGRRVAWRIAAVGLVALSGLAGLVVARWARAPLSADPGKAEAKSPFPKGLFKDWKKPDVVLVLTGQQSGYLLPCGCSRPQIGGLERRYNLLQMFKEAGWPAVPVDLGDVPQTGGPAGLPNQQGTIKYIYAMKAMKEMKYAGVGFGVNEAQVGLPNLLAMYSLNNAEPPVVMANLINAPVDYPDQTKFWGYSDTPSELRVGVTTIVSPGVAGAINRLDPTPRFGLTGPTLQNVLKQMTAAKVSLPVLLYQGSVEPTGAKACAEEFPEFPVVLCLGDDAPPTKPTLVKTKAGTESLLLQVGIKGKFVGVVGAWKTAKGFDFKYERVEMSEDFLTPEDKQKDHPITALLEKYTAELKESKPPYLERYGQMKHPLQAMEDVKGLAKPGDPDYVGSQACKKCHADAYDVWEKSDHSHAYKTLVDAKNPKNRQYDPECIVCHTVGFGYKTGFKSETETPKLKDVGCESCHGPSGAHARNPMDVAWQKRINPWRHLPAANQKRAIDQMCQKCHDQENDVHWTGGGFGRKWPKVEHYTPKPKDE